jgi:hypothetical protein
MRSKKHGMLFPLKVSKSPYKTCIASLLEKISVTFKVSFPQAKRVGNPSEDGEGFRTSRNDKHGKRAAWALIFFALFAIHYSLFTVVSASEKWTGVDETVVEKYAKEHGREASEPLINTDQGDLLLFVFLIAGVVGGFAAGYYWKELVVKGQRHDSCEKEKIKS